MGPSTHARRAGGREGGLVGKPMLLRVLLLCLIVISACVPPAPTSAPREVKATDSSSAVDAVAALMDPPRAAASPASNPLAVTAVVPEPDASAVLFDSTVYVQFNRP